MSMALALSLLLGQDLSEASKIVVQHDARMKPLDTFARQLLQYLTEKERFREYRDPATGRKVEVFPTADPVYAVLLMVSKPESIRELRFIKITHPELKRTFGLNPDLAYYSLADLEPSRERFEAESMKIDPDDATSEQRAVAKIVHQFRQIEEVYREEILRIVPVPYGKANTWMTPVDVRRWLQGTAEGEVRARLDDFASKEPGRRAALEAAVSHWDAAMKAFAAGDASKFAGLAAELRALNPGEALPEHRLETELLYNRVRPFHWASAVFFIASLLHLFGFIARSRGLWAGGLAVLAAAVGLCAYGYALRWIIADRYPLSNHYESMIMCAFGAGIVAVVVELLLKTKNLVGLGASLAATLLLVLANNVPTFAEQGFVAPLVPALQTVWMTIHVPVIMTGYAMGFILAVLAHVHLIRWLANRATPEHTQEMDHVMYWVLRLTVLFLLIGIILGAVWAGEAWGRPWGWDMKETWALITLLCYIAVLHARFLGALRPFGTSVCSLIAFQVLILTYYGVNFLFGKGLHTYGFGAGDWFYLGAFFAAEWAFLVACGAVFAARRVPLERPKDPDGLREE
jgi:cytochrome c-type biogenesis protein CcsB